MKELTSREKIAIEAKEAGLKAACKSYIDLMVANAPEGSSRQLREYLQWKWIYEDEDSDEIIGVSVGIWFGPIGDQHWEHWQFFSISTSIIKKEEIEIEIVRNL